MHWIILLVAFFFVSCSIVDRYPIDNRHICKNHNFISQLTKFDSYRIPRIGIFPVIMDRNLRVSRTYSEELTRIISQRMLSEGILPVVEIIDRWEVILHDEFFKGNHVTLRLARDLGLDYIVLFYATAQDSKFSLYTKILDVSRGVTLYYGHSLVKSSFPWYKAVLESTVSSRDLRLEDFSNTVSRCVVDGILNS